MFSNPSREFRRETLNGKTYIGEVVDNNDPEKQQRIKIRIPELHRGVPDEDLPWCLPNARLGAQGNSSGGVGSMSIPVVGSKIEVSMGNNSSYFPTYGGSPTTKDVKNEFAQHPDYPHVYGHVDRSGNKFEVNTAKNTVSFTHVTGTTILIKADGSVDIGGPKDVTIACKGDMNLGCEGNMTISSKGSLDVLTDGSLTVSTKSGADVIAGGFLNLHGGAGIMYRSGFQLSTVPIVPGAPGPMGPESAKNISVPAARTAPKETAPTGKKDL